MMAVINFRATNNIPDSAQDEKLRIRKRKRSRKIWNRCGNTTGNTRFRCRLCDVYSCFRCCGYSGTVQHFTRFHQVSVEGNNCFRKRNFMFTCAKTYDNVPETRIFYISIDVITSKRSRKFKITFRFSLVSVNVIILIVPKNTRLLFWIKFSLVFADNALIKKNTSHSTIIHFRPLSNFRPFCRIQVSA